MDYNQTNLKRMPCVIALLSVACLGLMPLGSEVNLAIPNER